MLNGIKKQGILVAIGTGLGTATLVATGVAIRSANKAKMALSKVNKLEDKMIKLNERVKDLNQTKLNERKLYEIDRDLEILKMRDKMINKSEYKPKSENSNNKTK